MSKHKEKAEKCAWAISNKMNWGHIEPHIPVLLRRAHREHLKRKTATEPTKAHKESEKQP